MVDTLVLVDGHALAYRMFFALEHTRMSNAAKVPTWAVYGFFNALFALLREVKPDAMAVSFDIGKETFRNDLYEAYKANREAMPEELRIQMGIIHEGVEKLGMPIYEVPGYEADDVIGTVARQAITSGQVNRVLILTGDQDAFQLVEGDQVQVLIPSRKPREGLKWYNREAVIEKLGIPPEQVIDFKGLKGDSSDNIPGVKGIGDKTAVKLLSKYPTVEAIYEHLEEVASASVKRKLEVDREKAFLSKKLATIVQTVPLTLNPEECHLEIPDIQQLLDYLHTYEFKGFVQQAPALLAPFMNGREVNTVVATEKQIDRDTANGNGQGSLFSVSLMNQRAVTAEKDQSSTPSKAISTQETILEKVARVLQVEHQVVTSMDQLNILVETLQQEKIFALDVETTGLDVHTACLVGIAISVSPGSFQVGMRSATNILDLTDYPDSFQTLLIKEDAASSLPIDTYYIPIGHEQREGGDLLLGQLPYETVMEKLGPLLQDPTVYKIAHNAKYEVNVFRAWGCPWAGPIYDTMIASYVYQPEQRHGLKSLAYTVFHDTMQEIKKLIGTGKKAIPFSQVSLEEAAPYAACDAYETLRLAQHFIPYFDESQNTLFYEIELPLMYVLAEMEYTGVALNTEHLKGLSVVLDQKLVILERDIYELAGLEFNINSPKQVGEVLFEKLGIPPLKKTAKKTGYSTDAKVLEQLAEEHTIVKKLLDYRQLFKLKSTYVDTLPTLVNSKTGRVHTSFNQTVTATGRLSSSDPNLQNIPIRTEEGRRIREAFVPAKREDGTKSVLLAADYSQIELRLLAHFSEDPNLLAAFQSGQDIHAATAALVFDIPLEEVTKEQRYRAKAVNFGVIYGQTAHGLSQQLGISRFEAQEFINRYFERYDRVQACIEAIKEEARQTGKATTIAGRIRDLSDGLNSSIRGVREFSERAAFNTPLQGSAADLMKVAMIRLYRKLETEAACRDLQSRMILQVHDEVVLEVPDHELADVTTWVQWAMELGQPLRVPLVVDMHTGATWMEA